MVAPRRVLQLASTSDMGGTERMILFLAENVDRQKFQFYVASLLGSGELLQRSQPHVAGVQHFHYRFPVDPPALWKLVKFIRKNRIELVHTYGLRADVVGRTAARFAGVRAVVSSIRSIDPWRNNYHTMLDRLTAGNVKLFIANSHAGKQATVAREKFPAELIEVVHGGIPVRDIPRERRDEIRQGLGVSSSAFPVVGILANLREMKGHRDVIAALPAIRERFPDVVFLFAGRDDSNGGIEGLAREEGVHSSIRFLGYVADTPALLAAMDIFLMASTWEGLPASVLEAMHAGVPIITTSVGGIPELVTHEQEALMINPSSRQEISAAVIRLAEDATLRTQLAENAQSRAQREFTLEKMMRKTEELYERVLR
jgi:glycosyltransferase involved in cell wall biosynthesis